MGLDMATEQVHTTASISPTLRSARAELRYWLYVNGHVTAMNL